MSIAIFKNEFSITILYDFLEENNCNKIGENFVITKEFYKRTVMQNKLSVFLNEITPLYYKSKQFYSTRDMNYSRFLTIIRQICNFHTIDIDNRINYSKSKHEISYRINIEQLKNNKTK